MLVCSWVRWMRGGRTGLHLEKILHAESDFHIVCAGLVFYSVILFMGVGRV